MLRRIRNPPSVRNESQPSDRRRRRQRLATRSGRRRRWCPLEVRTFWLRFRTFPCTRRQLAQRLLGPLPPLQQRLVGDARLRRRGRAAEYPGSGCAESASRRDARSHSREPRQGRGTRGGSASGAPDGSPQRWSAGHDPRLDKLDACAQAGGSGRVRASCRAGPEGRGWRRPCASDARPGRCGSPARRRRGAVPTAHRAGRVVGRGAAPAPSAQAVRPAGRSGRRPCRPGQGSGARAAARR